MSIDVAISGDRNVIKKEAEKILKYEDLITEIQRMWNVKAKLIPVIKGSTGTISKSGNNRGDWNHFKITQTIPEEHIGKVRN